MSKNSYKSHPALYIIIQHPSPNTPKMSLNFLILLLIFGEMVFTAPSLAFQHPSHKPPPEYKPISPEYRTPIHQPPPKDTLNFHKPTVPVIPQHPETFEKPLVWNHRPSPAAKHPVYIGDKPRAPPPPSSQEYGKLDKLDLTILSCHVIKCNKCTRNDSC